eukprot:TRINITY_DN4209_c0_g1_i13.p1 TRINITY_DN4209_c0_g1~~TRINITY_DN4209_c0_g1_i13.p1  ORF type:complete len:100 (-),score=24.22 TRINITY_DN4209_c0_g1_i13:56-355(-)
MCIRDRYYPDQTASGSWADNVLAMLGYDQAPQLLQNLIQAVYELGTQKIQFDGCRLVLLPWFHCLDGSCTEDYCARVEPSSSGGQKMAKALVHVLCGGE